MGSSRADRRRAAEARRSKQAQAAASATPPVNGYTKAQIAQLKDFTLSQSAQVAAILGILVTLVYLLSTSRGSFTTVRLLLEYGGYTAPLITALTVVLPWLLVQPACLAKYYENTQIAVFGYWPWQYARRCGVIVLFSLYLYSFQGPVLGAYLLLYLLVTWLDGRSLAKIRQKISEPEQLLAVRKRAFLRDDVWLIFAVIPALLGSGLTTYGAREQITLNDGRTIIGSVVGAKDDYTLTLGKDGDARLTPTEIIENRELCSGTALQPVWSYFLLRFTVRTPGASCDDDN